MKRTNVSIVVNDGTPIRMVIGETVGTIVDHFAEGKKWPTRTEIDGVLFGADFADKSLHHVQVDYVSRDDYTDMYVTCQVKRKNIDEKLDKPRV